MRRVAPQESDATVARIWQDARSGWRARTALQWFTQAPLQPTLAQLEELVRHRHWLGEHLREQPSRDDAFGVAAASFHGLTYGQGTASRRWRAEYKRHGLWGAFAGVPVREQGSFEDALSAYAGRNPSAAVAVARTYLSSAQSLAAAQFAARRIVDEVIRPIIKHAASTRCLDVLDALGLNSELALYERVVASRGLRVVVDQEASDEAVAVSMGDRMSLSPSFRSLIRDVVGTLTRSAGWPL